MPPSYRRLGGLLAALKSIPVPGVDGQHELTLETGKEGEPQRIKAKLLVNAAGLWATKVASLLKGMPEAHIPKQHYARGVYFTMAGEPFGRSSLQVDVGQASAGHAADQHLLFKTSMHGHRNECAVRHATGWMLPRTGIPVPERQPSPNP